MELDERKSKEGDARPRARKERRHARKEKRDARNKPARPAIPTASSPVVRKVMQGNKGKDTKPELAVRQALREAGLRGYRLHWKAPGRPDVAWPGRKTAVFVNGCFWHRCPHCNPPRPHSNVEYWSVKFDRNVERDERNVAALKEAGWNVHVVWECQLKPRTFARTILNLLEELSKELGKPLNADFLHELECRAKAEEQKAH